MRGGLLSEIPSVVLEGLTGPIGLVWPGSVHGEANLVVHGGVFVDQFPVAPRASWVQLLQLG